MSTTEKAGGERQTHTDNVVERINSARRIIAETDFSKSGTVKGAQSYSFIPIAQILDAVRKAHAEAGVTVVFGRPEYDSDQYEKRWSYEKKGNYGMTTWHAAVGHIRCTVYGSSIDDRLEMDVPFEAQDNSDKLTNKIITNAERCLYRVLYAIDEGDGSDPETVNEPMSSDVREQMRQDPFFGKPDPAPEPKPEKDDSILLDRDVAQIRQSLTLWMADRELASIVRPCREAWGSVDRWTDDQCRQIYARCVRKKQGVA